MENILREKENVYQLCRKLIPTKLDQMQNRLVHHDEYKIDELNLDWMLMKVDLIDHSMQRNEK